MTIAHDLYLRLILFLVSYPRILQVLWGASREMHYCVSLRGVGVPGLCLAFQRKNDVIATGGNG